MKVGKRYGSWAITQFEPLRCAPDGEICGGILKLVDQENFEVMLIKNDKAPKDSKWCVSIRNKSLRSKSLEVVVEGALRIHGKKKNHPWLQR